MINSPEEVDRFLLKSSQDYTGLAQNNNPGVEFEYAIAYRLMTGEQRSEFRGIVIAEHAKKNQILSIIDVLARDAAHVECDSVAALERFVKIPASNRLVSCPTQEDGIGPSDVVVFDQSGIVGKYEKVGFSIKKMNSNIKNPGPKHFLSRSTLCSYKDRLRTEVVESHVAEATSRYGPLELMPDGYYSWHRRGGDFRRMKHGDAAAGLVKTSAMMDFIRDLRDEVIRSWEGKSGEDKRTIFEQLFSLQSPILCTFEVMTYDDGSIAEISRKRFSERLCGDSITASAHGDYVVFECHGAVLQLQVKFNNGILERCKNGGRSIEINGIPM